MESLKGIPLGLRETRLALRITKLQMVGYIVLLQVLPGILTGGILRISRAADVVIHQIFTMPTKKQAEDYVTGRFG